MLHKIIFCYPRAHFNHHTQLARTRQFNTVMLVGRCEVTLPRPRHVFVKKVKTRQSKATCLEKCWGVKWRETAVPE